MWFFRSRKSNATLRDNGSRPIKFVETGHNMWQIVYADECVLAEREKN